MTGGRQDGSSGVLGYSVGLLPAPCAGKGELLYELLQPGRLRVERSRGAQVRQRITTKREREFLATMQRVRHTRLDNEAGGWPAING